MAIDDLPLPVVNFLNVIGVPWPYLNEDTVWQFSGLMRQFGQAVQTTHQDATDAVTGIAETHKAQSTELMMSGWSKLSAQHVDEIVTGCGVLADALDAAGGYIVAQKGEAIAELVGMAAAFVADQAAAVVTFGLSEAALPLIEEAGEKLVDFLTQQLIQVIVGKVVEAALNPLLALVQKAASGMTFSALEDVLGAGDGSGGPGFSMNPDEVTAHSAKFADYADTVQQHAQTFSTNVSGLSFS